MSDQPARDFVFWQTDDRAIVIRAESEEDAIERLSARERSDTFRVQELELPPHVGDHERKLVAQLADQPGWEILRRVALERMHVHFRQLTRAFMSRAIAPDYDQLQWQRGVFAGMKFLLDNPLIEAEKLKRLLEQEEGD